MERVDALELRITKLAHATGVTAPEERSMETLDGVTNDLDIEALTKSVLDVSRDLDQYLGGLLKPEPLRAEALKNEIALLENDISQKKALMAKATTAIAASELKVRELKERQVQHLYNPDL